MSAPRCIVHADMDAFYASIEQRDDSSLRGRPVIVGATSPRGVVAAASYEARRFGVRSAMPGFKARQLCPEGVFLPSNMQRYAAVSRQIQALFLDFTPLVEPLALDEAFLDVSGSVHLFGDALSLARELKRRVYTETELRVSVGVAPSKLVAKIACNLGKPDGLYIVPEGAARELLDPLDIGALWGVGPVLEQRLRAAGIHSFGDLVRHDTQALAPLLGRRARELQALARGEDEREVLADRAPKSIGEENTFETDVSAEPRILEVLRVHADAVARRLRRAGYQGRTVSVKIKLAHADRTRVSERGPHYPLLTRSRTLAEATDDAEQIATVARELWASAALTQPIRLLGVSVSALSATGAQPRQQLALFDAADARGRPAEFARVAPNSRRPLGPTLDAITERFGSGAIRRAAAAPGKVTHGRGIKRGDS